MQAFRTEINFAIKICATRKKFLRIIPAAASNRKRRVSRDNTAANRERKARRISSVFKQKGGQEGKGGGKVNAR